MSKKFIVSNLPHTFVGFEYFNIRWKKKRALDVFLVITNFSSPYTKNFSTNFTNAKIANILFNLSITLLKNHFKFKLQKRNN